MLLCCNYLHIFIENFLGKCIIVASNCFVLYMCVCVCFFFMSLCGENYSKRKRNSTRGEYFACNNYFLKEIFIRFKVGFVYVGKDNANMYFFVIQYSHSKNNKKKTSHTVSTLFIVCVSVCFHDKNKTIFMKKKNSRLSVGRKSTDRKRFPFPEQKSVSNSFYFFAIKFH